MNRSFLDYEEFEYENLLEALFDKEILEEVLEEKNVVYTTAIIIRDSDFLLTINYATENKKDNRKIS